MMNTTEKPERAGCFFRCMRGASGHRVEIAGFGEIG
jgi:hypothetical protein